MAFWNDLGDKISDTGGITSSFGALAGAKDLKGVISGLAGVAGSINDYFNKGKPLEYAGFDINAFRSSFVTETDGGLARNNLFEVMIEPPSALDSSGKNSIQRLFSKRVEEVELPGKTLKTEDIVTYGPPRKIATGTTYSDGCSMSILLSESLFERKFLIDWMESVQPALESSHDGDVSYYDEYRGKVQIRVYDTEGSVPRMIVTLHEAYPTLVSENKLNWDPAKDVMKLNVKFSYRNFTELYNPKGESLEDTSLLGMIRGFRDDVRGMITDIRNMRYTFKQVKTNLSSLKYNLQKDFKTGDPLGKIEVLAGAPAAIAETLGSSAFRMLESTGKVLGGADKNYSKYFSF